MRIIKIVESLLKFEKKKKMWKVPLKIITRKYRKIVTNVQIRALHVIGIILKIRRRAS